MLLVHGLNLLIMSRLTLGLNALISNSSILQWKRYTLEGDSIRIFQIKKGTAVNISSFLKIKY